MFYHDETYFTEEELLYPSSLYYGATNRDKITPIREDWKLLKYVEDNYQALELERNSNQ